MKRPSILINMVLCRATILRRIIMTTISSVRPFLIIRKGPILISRHLRVIRRVNAFFRRFNMSRDGHTRFFQHGVQITRRALRTNSVSIHSVTRRRSNLLSFTNVASGILSLTGPIMVLLTLLMSFRNFLGAVHRVNNDKKYIGSILNDVSSSLHRVTQITRCPLNFHYRTSGRTTRTRRGGFLFRSISVFGYRWFYWGSSSRFPPFKQQIPRSNPLHLSQSILCSKVLPLTSSKNRRFIYVQPTSNRSSRANVRLPMNFLYLAQTFHHKGILICTMLNRGVEASLRSIIGRVQ